MFCQECEVTLFSRNMQVDSFTVVLYYYYIDEIIKAKVDEQGIGYAEFARRINCARTSLYNLFNSKSIDVERLLIISEVLNFNFIEEVYLKESRTSVSDLACIIAI